MVLVSVAGACSRAGKTALAETFLRAWPPGLAVAVKFTTTEDVFQRCPRGTPCVVCDIDVPFRLVEDPRVLAQEGTDTARLQAAGARLVIWAIARQSAGAEAWAAVQRRIAAAPVVVMEGSTIVDWAAPDLLTFVIHPHLSPERWKPTSAPLLRRAGLVVVNGSADGRPPSPEVLARLRADRGDDWLVADVRQPLEEWAPDLLARLPVLDNGERDHAVASAARSGASPLSPRPGFTPGRGVE